MPVTYLRLYRNSFHTKNGDFPAAFFIRTFMGEEVDRVTISLYEFDGSYDSWIYNYPVYADSLDYARGKTDKMYFWRLAGGELLFYGVIESGSIRRIEWNDGD